MKNNHITFRDPEGSICKIENRIFRFINLSGNETLKLVSNSKILQECINKDFLISYKQLSLEGIKNLLENENFLKVHNKLDPKSILEHKKVDFVSYPYEWSSDMLFDAANLTLDLQEKIINENISLKDATPYNVLYEGSKPIFIDLLSFEKKDPLDPIWLAYSQFVRMFILPLFVNQRLGISLDQIFINKTDGLEVSDCIKAVNYFSLRSYSLILLPHLLSKFSKNKHYKKVSYKNPDIAKFILQSLVKRAKKQLKKLKPKNKDSFWAKYMLNKDHYSDDSFSKKEKFIEKALDLINPKRVLDIGCNTGHFSILAANKKSKVVSIDYDSASISMLFQKAKEKKLDILPLVVNICRPTPSIGWQNREYQSFLDRAKNHFDMVFMLAVIHHMLATELIPLEEIAKMASEITKDGLIIEFVTTKDPMFQKLIRSRDYLFKDVNIENFKNIFSSYFEIDCIEELVKDRRYLFLMRKK